MNLNLGTTRGYGFFGDMVSAVADGAKRGTEKAVKEKVTEVVKEGWSKKPKKPAVAKKADDYWEPPPPPVFSDDEQEGGCNEDFCVDNDVEEVAREIDRVFRGRPRPQECMDSDED